MKKKIIATIFLSIVILTAAGVTFIPRKTEAQALLPVAAAITKYAAATAVDNWVDSLLADLGEGIMRIQGYFLSLTGLLLNISIVLTMNIKAIYQATPAIESTWIVIRNLSSIFIIFALLYTSILTILDQGGQKLSQLVKNIVIAGLLINFSLFFTKLAIDASNLVSLQFYRAIVPNSQQMLAASGTNGRINWSGIINSSYSTGGISNVFMQALQIPRIYNVSTGKTLLNTTNSFGNKFRIAVSTIVGTIIMVIASLSFLAMAIAFIIRIVILLLLMGFSPIYFVGMIFPEIKKDLSDKWFKWLKEQLIFMPVYLLFMYVAMSFLSTINPDQTKSFFGALSDVQLQAGGTSSNSGVLLASVGLLFQYSIALILMIIPLFAAKEIGGGLSTKWGIQAKDWVAGKVKGWAATGAGAVGRNTAGRVGRLAGGAFDSMAAATQTSPYGRAATSVLRNLGISQAVRGKLSEIEKGKYGGRQSLEDVEKEDKDRAKVISGIQRNKAQFASIGAFMQTPGVSAPGVAPTGVETEFKKQVGAMDVKELEKMDVGILTDPKFAIHIPQSKYEALLKSDSLTTADQQRLKNAREGGLKTIAGISPATPGGTPGGADYLINTHLKGKPQDIAKLPSDVLRQREVAKLFDPAMLRKMIDENVSKADRDEIRNIITSYIGPAAGTTLHKSQQYLATNLVF